MTINTLIKAARLPFLLLTPVCIFFAYALAIQSSQYVSLPDTAMILLGAIAAHLAVNLLNEYQDFRSGLDLQTIKTPFSGGSGALPENPNGAIAVLWAAIVHLLIVCLVGLYFLYYSPSLLFLPIGVFGVLLIISYTPIINRFPWLCLLAPGLGFGTFMVLASVLLLSNTLTPVALALSLVPFFQINNLLLLNQFPDIDADKNVGRNHFPIAFGTAISAKVYGLFAFLPMLIITLLVALKQIPTLCLLTLLALIPAIAVTKAVNQYQDKIAEHPQFLAMNVMLTLATPTLLAITLLVT